MFWMTIPLGILMPFAALFLFWAGTASRTYSQKALDPLQKYFTYPLALVALVACVMCFSMGGTPNEWWAIGIASGIALLTVVITAIWWYRVAQVGRPR